MTQPTLTLTLNLTLIGLIYQGDDLKKRVTDPVKYARAVEEALEHLSCLVTPRTAHYLNPVWGEIFGALHAVTREKPDESLRVMSLVGRLVSDVGLHSPVVLEEAMSFSKELEEGGDTASVVASLSIFPKVIIQETLNNNHRY